MVQVKGKLSKNDKQLVGIILNEVPDYYNDFYITSDNMRLLINKNPSLLFSNLNKGDKIAFDKDGIALIIGFSDKSPRKYLKVLAKNKQIAYNLAKVLVEWNNNGIELYAKLKKTNPLIEIFKELGFEFKASRGKEILLYRIAKKEIMNVR